MIVSVFSDASFCSQTGAGGWGGWAKSDRGQVERGGSLVEKVWDANQAEFLAAINAIHMALVSGVAQRLDRILIQSDSQYVGHILNSPTKFADYRPVPIQKGLDHLFRLKANYMIYVEYRHVKGHMGTSTPRNAVNTRCDALARQGMLDARARR